MQHFKFENSRIRFLMLRIGYVHVLKKVTFMLKRISYNSKKMRAF